VKQIVVNMKGPQESNRDDRVLLEVQNLSLSFGGLMAVNSVDFNVRVGEIVGLIGPNGSGKTTFFNIISGVYKPDNGRVLFTQEDITGKKPHEITKRGMARTFQNSRLFGQLSVLDNVIVGMHSKHRSNLFDIIFRYKTTKRELVRFSEESLRILGYFSSELRENYLRCVLDLPQGDRRKVEICRALASGPKLILLDEPSAGMATEETEKLMDDIRKVKEKFQDISIIIIEHDMRVIEKIAEKVIVFNYGGKIAEGTYLEIANNPVVLEAYLGDEQE